MIVNQKLNACIFGIPTEVYLIPADGVTITAKDSPP